MPNNSATKKYHIVWSLFIFGGVFAAAGLLVFWFTTASPVLRYLETQSWLEVPANIRTISLESYVGDSTTWNISATYDYQINGIEYSNNRVTLNVGSDSDKDFWQDLYNRLKQSQRSNSSIAYVNPTQPKQSYLDRSLHTKMMVFGGVFVLLFGAIGAGLMFLAMRGQNEHSLIEAAKDGVASQQKNNHAILFFVGFLFVGVSIPILLVNTKQIDSFGAALLAFFFPLLGSLMLYAGWRLRKRYKQIGPTLFFPDPLPGNVGGQIGGHFALSQGDWLSAPDVYLICEHSYYSGTGKNRTKKSEVIWQEKSRGYWQKERNGGKLHVLFDVPGHLPVNGEDNKYSGAVQWYLACEGKLSLTHKPQRDPRIDDSRALRRDNWKIVTYRFKRQWALPVTSGSAQANYQLPDSIRESIQQDLSEQALTNAHNQIQISSTAQGLKLVSPFGRHMKIAIPVSLAGLLFFGIGTFLIYLTLQDKESLWFIGSVFTLLGALTTALGVFWLGRSLETVVSPPKATMVRLMFGRALYQRTAIIPANAVLQLDLTLTASGSESSVRNEFYKLWVAGVNGEKIVLAEGIRGKHEGEAIKKQVTKILSHSH